jgi:hypothetical protein
VNFLLNSTIQVKYTTTGLDEIPLIKRWLSDRFAAQVSYEGEEIIRATGLRHGQGRVRRTADRVLIGSVPGVLI